MPQQPDILPAASRFWRLLASRRASGPTVGTVAPAPDALLLQWCAFVGLLAYVAILLARHGVWSTLKDADPTGITLLIIAIFAGATLWCGWRCRFLGKERRALAQWMEQAPAAAGDHRSGAAPADDVKRHTTDYLEAVAAKHARSDMENAQLTSVLAERLHGPSESAWWVNGILIKLGLLGKVIGFSILALQIAQIESFDPSQTQTLLKSLTGGLGVALLTTAVGLVGNIILGFQLVRLDRCADAILADALHFAETGMPAGVR